MKFQSQKVAWGFFATCMLLLSLQVIYGFIMGFAHAGYDGLHDWIPFHTARATHTNLLVMWLLAGFMGAAYYIVPEEADRELYWPKLAYVQWAAFVAVGVTAYNQNFGNTDIGFGTVRRDDALSADMVVNYALDERWSLRADLSQSRNRSNQDLYDSSRKAASLKLRYQY